jgi:predicted AAA+ superfamily ATPase
MKPRTLAKTIRKAAKTFPAIVVTGPRQSGKTTLLKHLFASSHAYANLEDPDIRLLAKSDPRTFLGRFPPPVVIDEIQYAPEVLSYIKTRIDEQRTPGQWILSGSQNFVLMQGVSQSLAGRAAVLTLLPLSFCEWSGNEGETIDMLVRRTLPHAPASARRHDIPLAPILLRGMYPEPATHPHVDINLWCGSYLTTYVERDIRSLAAIGDLTQFEQFVRHCAVRSGQILNLSSLARDVGVSFTTARRWLSLLETGYQVLLLPPYSRNIGKRMVKSPKLYFNDTALAAYLLGLHDERTLLASPHFGSIFETLIVTDFWKRFLHAGMRPSLSYLRTRDGLEVDLVVERGDAVHLFEMKANATIIPKHAEGLLRAQRAFKSRVQSASLISLTAESFHLTHDIRHWNWHTLLAQ